MLPAAQLKTLINEGRTDAAIALCRAQLSRYPGSGYYDYWLSRLTAEPAAATDAGAGASAGESPLPARPTRHVDVALKRELLEGFAQAPYRIAPRPTLSGDLDKDRAKVISTIPFRSEIYLPTAKIPLDEQVGGLCRVHSLVQSDNLEATQNRFEVLKTALRSLGKDRIFVIGNGPSLKRTDLELLRDEVTIGFNGIFLHDTFTPTIYLVEDHLVAEDRRNEIHAYDCFVKVFPSYLGYCIDPQDNTLFLNHRPRISYPVDTDFSADAGRITYTGGTVTYTGLQLAASLGFREIILVGVDASYQVHDVERSDSYGTGVLTSKSDDANHFDPRYFGKGYRWHDPNVNTMLQAYRKVRNYARANDLKVLNATLGGQLEVFERIDFHGLFPRETVHPRVAVLDFTSIDQLCATGIVKQNLFAGWPKGSMLHVHAPNEGRLIAYQTTAHDLYAVGSDEVSIWPAFRGVVEFDPQVLYLRPTHDRVVMTALQAVTAAVLDRPWVMHYMDDWLEKAKSVRTAPVAAAHESIMAKLFAGAAHVFSICDRMSGFLCDRHALRADKVSSAHNYLLERGAAASRRPPLGDRPLKIRYFGGLEPDMGLATILDLAAKVEACNAVPGARPIAFEIFTGQTAITRHGDQFAAFPATRLNPQIVDYDAYLDSLATSDVNLVSYNFDDRSLDYVRYSLANKLPELLSVQTPFLVVGHPEIATVRLLKDAGYPLVVDTLDYDLRRLVDFVTSPGEDELVQYHAAIAALKEEFSEARNRHGFQQRLRRAAAAPAGRLDGNALPVAELAVLCEAAKASLTKVRDLDCLVRLPLVERAVMDRALALVRSHGLEWSVRKEFEPLKALFAGKSGGLAAGDDDAKARAIAFLICSLGVDAFKAVNDPIRAWLLAAYPLPTAR